ncbi:MAG: peroxiredoxin [Woeseiaceae bacterium]
MKSKLLIVFAVLGVAIVLAVLANRPSNPVSDLIGEPVTTAVVQPDVGEQAPEFELPDQTGQLHSLEDYRDQWVVLYFYPKDGTPGCTTEACEFRDNIFAFRDLNAQILGVSIDSVDSHRSFAENHSLPFPLLADVNGGTADAYGVKTRMLGMTVAKRQTFIIAPGGIVARHYVDVKPDEHSAQVIADLKQLSATS